MKKILLMMAMVVVMCSGVAVSEDESVADKTPGVIYNRSMTQSLIVARDFGGQWIFQVLGPNSSTPANEDWDYVQDPASTGGLWYKCWGTTGWTLTFYGNYSYFGDPIFNFGPGDLLTTPAYNSIGWVPPTPPVIVEPVINTTTINPLGPGPLCPYLEINTSQPFVQPPLTPPIPPNPNLPPVEGP